MNPTGSVCGEWSGIPLLTTISGVWESVATSHGLLAMWPQILVEMVVFTRVKLSTPPLLHHIPAHRRTHTTGGMGGREWEGKGGRERVDGWKARGWEQGKGGGGHVEERDGSGGGERPRCAACVAVTDRMPA